MFHFQCQPCLHSVPLSRKNPFVDSMACCTSSSFKPESFSCILGLMSGIESACRSASDFTVSVLVFWELELLPDLGPPNRNPFFIPPKSPAPAPVFWDFGLALWDLFESEDSLVDCVWLGVVAGDAVDGSCCPQVLLFWNESRRKAEYELNRIWDSFLKSLLQQAPPHPPNSPSIV